MRKEPSELVFTQGLTNLWLMLVVVVLDMHYAAFSPITVTLCSSRPVYEIGLDSFA